MTEETHTHKLIPRVDLVWFDRRTCCNGLMPDRPATSTTEVTLHSPAGRKLVLYSLQYIQWRAGSEQYQAGLL